MSARDLITKLAEKGVRLRLVDEEVKVAGWPLLTDAEQEELQAHRAEIADLLGEVSLDDPKPEAEAEEAPPEPPEREIVGQRGVAGAWVPIYRDEIEGQPYWGQGGHPIGTSSAMDRLRQQAQATANELEKAKERRPDTGPPQFRTGR